MTNKVKISVIVPVYNTADTIRKCLDSVVEQSYKKYELIVVDDGSNDGSEIICREYSEKYSQIKLIRTDNHGLVSARKAGVNIAEGEYITFVDSDDWIEYDQFEKVVENSEDADIVAVGCEVNEEDGRDYTIAAGTKEGFYSGDELLKLFSKMMYDTSTGKPGLFQAIWAKFIKRELISEVIASIDEGITLGEDAACVYRCVLKSNSMKLLNVSGYHYCIRTKSMTRVNDIDKFEKIRLFSEFMLAAFEAYPAAFKLKLQLRHYLFHLVNMVSKQIYSISNRTFFILPFENLSGKKIVIYCAGAVGKDYYDQFLGDNSITVVAWIDNGRAGYVYDEFVIEGKEKIYSCSYDYIVIANSSEKVATEIKEDLISMGIEKSTILWEMPHTIPGVVRNSVD